MLREAINNKCIFWVSVPKSLVPPPLPLFGTHIFWIQYLTFDSPPPSFNPLFEVCSKENFYFTSEKDYIPQGIQGNQGNVEENWLLLTILSWFVHDLICKVSKIE